MRYYIYIALPAGLTKRVAAIARRYGTYNASKPHITLVIPREVLHRAREQTLVSALRAAANSLAPCRITYARMAYFGAKEYIYVPVRNTSALAFCQHTCAAAVSGLLKPPRIRPPLVFRPHITLAARLGPEQGERIWSALKHRRFHGTFLCTEIRLLRKAKHATRWRLVSRFPLRG